MKKFMLFASLGLTLTLTTGFTCSKTAPIQIATPVSNEQLQAGYGVKQLFKVDGCTVYTFWDNRRVYFVSCKGSTAWQDKSGKVTNDHGVYSEVTN